MLTCRHLSSRSGGDVELTDDYFLSSLVPVLAALLVLVLASAMSSADSADGDDERTASATWGEADDDRWDGTAYCDSP